MKLLPFIYREPQFFELQTTHKKNTTHLRMHVFTTYLTTRDLHYTLPLLREYLPSIFSSQCFNDLGLSFAKEAEATEIGHLFEHIILEYLCQLKIASGHNEALYSGKTSWNWKKDPTGVFHIVLNVAYTERELVYMAISKSILLLKKILFAQREKSVLSLELSKVVQVIPHTSGKQMG